MIFNFDVEIGDVLYDCDAEGNAAGGVDVLEIRLVGEDGASFVAVKREDLSAEVLTEIVAQATAERQTQLEGWLERQADSDR